jgi:hypothetical protein
MQRGHFSEKNFNFFFIGLPDLNRLSFLTLTFMLHLLELQRKAEEQKRKLENAKRKSEAFDQIIKNHNNPEVQVNGIEAKKFRLNI